MNRREMLLRTGAAIAALGVSSFPRGWAAPAGSSKRRIFMYSKSEGYQHDVVNRGKKTLSLAEQIVTDLGVNHGFDVHATKDGREFVNQDLSKFDAFLFETQGNLFKEGVDKQPPMTPDGKKALLKAIASGKGFVGCHCASDTFHSPGAAFEEQKPENRDPYIAMVGGEFIRHGIQQKSWMRVVDPMFPGAKNLQDFELMEEWYSLKNFALDLHVILAQDTQGMKGLEYERPNYPATWARMHHKGRVFFSSMGHRSDVWQNPAFQELLLGGLSWAVGDVVADVTPNLAMATPMAARLPHPPVPQKK